MTEPHRQIDCKRLRRYQDKGKPLPQSRDTEANSSGHGQTLL
jgi:hypothetical protein